MPSVKVTLKLDHGLYEWIKAHYHVFPTHETLEDQMVYMLRSEIAKHGPKHGIGALMHRLMEERWPGGVNTKKNRKRWKRQRRVSLGRN